MIIKTDELRSFLNDEFAKDFKDWSRRTILFAMKYEMEEKLRDALHVAFTAITNKIMVKASKKFNQNLEKYNLKVEIFETMELYQEDFNFSDSDEYWYLPMYEAYVYRSNDEEDQVSETTGRYCCIDSVIEELTSFIETAIEEN